MAHGSDASEKHNPITSKQSRPLWRMVYWGGRLCQIFGLLLLWWVLLIIPTAENIRALLYGGVTVAAAVFYLGWLVVRWAVKAT